MMPATSSSFPACCCAWSAPLVFDACRRLAGADRVRPARLDAALTDMLDGSRRMADDLIPRARLGINVMRDLAQAQGR